MSYDIIYSDWLSSSFDNVISSKEWNVFISDLHEAVDYQLNENKIDNFHNLLEHEKSILINKALQFLNRSLSYQIIQDRISQEVDARLNSEAERIIRIDINPYKTKTEAILTSTFEGIISILSRWPDLKYKLSKMFNQNIPSHLRHHVWKAVLSNPEVLQTYRNSVANKFKNSISKYDNEISKYCENLLNKENFLSEMKGSVGCFYGMKAILSYFQASTMGDAKLNWNDYLFALPIVYILHNKLSFREPPTLKVMEIFVQEYFTLRSVISADLPFVDSWNKVSKNQLRYFCQQVYRCMTTVDLSSAQTMVDYLIPAQESIVATETKFFELAGETIEKLLRPVITSLFVGYLSMECLLFVWDQFILGFEKPMFREKFWPMITGIFLELIVRRRIINRNSSTYVPLNEDLLKIEGPKLKPADFQYEINKGFYVEMMRIINTSNVSGIDPITEPTKWKHWFDSIHHITPISPQDRNEMRILRQQERDKFYDIQKRLELSEQEKSNLETILQSQAETYVANYEEAVNKYKNDNDKLKHEIDYLQWTNSETNKEVEKLKYELERMKELELRYSYAIHDRGIVPPVPTPLSARTSRSHSLRDFENYSFGPLSKLASDYISQLANSFHTLLQGEGQEKFDLNDDTINFMKKFKEDRQEAELKLFDHFLNPEELQSLDAANDGYYSQKIYQEMSKNSSEKRKGLGTQQNPDF